MLQTDTSNKRPINPEDWHEIKENGMAKAPDMTVTVEPSEELKDIVKPKRATLGEIINGTKKFLLAIATLAAVVLIVVLTQDTNPELAEQAITVGLPSAGTIGLSQFVHDLVKTRKGK